MPDYNVPATFKRFSNTEHAVTYTLPGHTSQKPRLAIFDRVIPVSTGKGSRVPQYRMRVIRGVYDAKGALLSTRISCEATFRYPVGALSTEVMEDMAVLGVAVSNADFQEDVAVELRLPL